MNRSRNPSNSQKRCALPSLGKKQEVQLCYKQPGTMLYFLTLSNILGCCSYLVEDFNCRIDDLQLQELLGEILDPEVDRSSIQAIQEEEGDEEHDDTKHVRQLLALQGPPLMPLLSTQRHKLSQGSHKSDGEHSED